MRAAEGLLSVALAHVGSLQPKLRIEALHKRGQRQPQRSRRVFRHCGEAERTAPTPRRGRFSSGKIRRQRHGPVAALM